MVGATADSYGAGAGSTRQTQIVDGQARAGLNLGTVNRKTTAKYYEEMIGGDYSNMPEGYSRDFQGAERWRSDQLAMNDQKIVEFLKVCFPNRQFCFVYSLLSG